MLFSFCIPSSQIMSFMSYFNQLQFYPCLITTFRVHKFIISHISFLITTPKILQWHLVHICAPTVTCTVHSLGTGRYNNTQNWILMFKPKTVHTIQHVSPCPALTHYKIIILKPIFSIKYTLLQNCSSENREDLEIGP